LGCLAALDVLRLAGSLAGMPVDRRPHQAVAVHDSIGRRFVPGPSI
jgi:hypothetical protein